MRQHSATITILWLSIIFIGMCVSSCTLKGSDVAQQVLPTPGNPYLPLWEHVPDGEPYVFEDPDQPGK